MFSITAAQSPEGEAECDKQESEALSSLGAPS